MWNGPDPSNSIILLHEDLRHLSSATLCLRCLAHSAVRRQLIVSNPIKTLLFPTRLPQKNRAPGFETRKVAAQVGGEISDTIYLHLRLAIYVRNLDLKHKSFG